MTSQTFNTADALRRLIAEGRISEEALQVMTGISRAAVASFLAAASGETGLSTTPGSLSSYEGARLSGLAAQLTEGFRVEDDVRLRGIIETLTAQCRLTHQNIALLTGVGLDELESFLRDPRSIALESKYELAIRASYLISAVANATKPIEP